MANSINSIQRALIVGGVHGNELNGIYVLKKFAEYPELIRRNSFETFTLLANKKAFAFRRRYIDQDLNRSFRLSDLQDLTRASYEDIRAREINCLFGVNGKTPVDVIIDTHSTTANMGLTLITEDNPFNLRLAAYLQSVNPLVNIYILPKSKTSSGLSSICELGCTLEIGAVPQGVLQADCFLQTEALIINTLDYLEQYNRGEIPYLDNNLTIFRHLGAVDYPKDESGELVAMIHPQLQFQDYQPLAPGKPMFLTFDGQTISYEGESTVYPVFINEAAYYEKGIAMCLTEKQQITV